MSRDHNQMSIQQIIRLMKQPTPLLKFGFSGKPKFVPFQLSVDNTMLTWASQKKKPEQTRVFIRDVQEIRFGQRTEKFKRTPRADLQHLSFSIVYRQENKSTGQVEECTLDLVCKDETEFEIWTSGMMALKDGRVGGEEPAPVADMLVGSFSSTGPLSPTASISSRSTTRSMAAVAEIETDAKRPKNAVEDVKSAFQGVNDVYSCGWGDWGQNCLAEMKNEYTFQIAKSLLGKGVLQIACGWSHSAVVLETGKLAVFGNRLGTGLSKDVLVPTLIELPTRASVQILSCGNFHSALVTDTGEVFTWGCNSNGQLGQGHNFDVREPRLVSSFGQVAVARVVCFSNSTAAVSKSGELFTWGCGEKGVLGHNDILDRNVPTPVEDLQGTQVRKLACGEGHVLAVTEDRETFAWGWNACGQLGVGHQEDMYRPTPVETLRGQDVAEISAGAVHSIAVISMARFNTRVLYVWGCNTSGQCGLGAKKSNILKPTVLAEMNEVDIIALDCGAHHTALLSSAGEVYTAGSNMFGQLGQPEVATELNEFKVVESLKGKGIRALSCGAGHTAVLVARSWVQDSEANECMACANAFSFLNRRHHCRNCGGIFCSGCSNKKIAILKYGLVEPVRVCTGCYNKLTGAR